MWNGAFGFDLQLTALQALLYLHVSREVITYTYRALVSGM